MECDIHIVKDCRDAVLCCSAVSLEKIKICSDQWVLTDWKDLQVAKRIKTFLDEDDSQKSVSYHRKCYMKFTDKTKIAAAIKRKQISIKKEILDPEENSNKCFHTASNSNDFTTSLTSRSKNNLPNICRNLEKLTGCQKPSNLFLNSVLEKNDQSMLMPIRGKDLGAIEMECDIHVVKDCRDAVQCCSAVSLEKIKICADQWVLTDWKELQVAKKIKTILDEDNSQKGISYHRKCYMKFTDKTEIAAAIKRKQISIKKEILDPEEDSNKCFHTASNSNDFTTSRSKNILPNICIICKKKKYICDKITLCKNLEKLTRCQKLSNLFLKAVLEKNDESILMHIHGKDLVAIELSYHRSCYRNYTSFLTKPASTKKTPEHQNSFKKFCNDVIEKKIIEENQILEMNEVTCLFVKTVLEEENVELNYTNANLKRKLKNKYPSLRFVKRPNRSLCELVLNVTP